MANPELLVVDSDVLAQIFLAKAHKLLSHLKTNFGVQPVITAEVDLELRWLGRFRDRFEPALEKALKHGALVRLDLGCFQGFLGKAPPGASWSSFQATGLMYGQRVDRGEAYTHAAGLTLGMPTASNDFRAIQVLQANNLMLPMPVLRTFDLCSFAFETKCMDRHQCEEFRKALRSENEGLPKAFMNNSFEDGLRTFRSRLRIASSAVNPAPQAFSETLYLAPR